MLNKTNGTASDPPGAISLICLSEEESAPMIEMQQEGGTPTTHSADVAADMGSKLGSPEQVWHATNERRPEGHLTCGWRPSCFLLLPAGFAFCLFSVVLRASLRPVGTSRSVVLESPSSSFPKLPSGVVFTFLLGVEGAGHHLHSKLYEHSPSWEFIRNSTIEHDCISLQGDLWNQDNMTEGIWSPQIGRTLPDTERTFQTLVDDLRALEEKAREAMDDGAYDNFDQQNGATLTISLNASPAPKGSGMMSYPNFGKINEDFGRSLQYPVLGVLYAACSEAGVRCGHTVLHRDPFEVLRSTSVHRNFGGSLFAEMRTLTAMQEIIYSQISANPDRLLGCWDYNKVPGEGGGIDNVSRLYGWTNAAKFKEVYFKIFHSRSPMSEEERKEVVPERVRPYMDEFVAATERVAQLCRKQFNELHGEIWRMQ